MKKNNFTNKIIATTAILAITLVLGAAAVFTFSLAPDADIVATTIGKELAAAQLRNQTANLET
jgi:hypothetical protein